MTNKIAPSVRIKRLLRALRRETVSIAYRRKQDSWVASIINHASGKKVTLVHSSLEMLLDKIIEFLTFVNKDKMEEIEKYSKIECPEDYIEYLEKKLESSDSISLEKFEKEKSKRLKNAELLVEAQKDHAIRLRESREETKKLKNWIDTFEMMVGPIKFEAINGRIQEYMETYQETKKENS